MPIDEETRKEYATKAENAHVNLACGPIGHLPVANEKVFERGLGHKWLVYCN